MNGKDRLASSPAPWPGSQTWLPHLLLAVAAIAVYGNSLANGFALDDVFIIQHNPRVHDIADQRAIWLTPYWPSLGTTLGLYRPLTIFSFAVEWALGAGRPLFFHSTNIALHALAASLVLLVIRHFTSTAAALLAALLFCVHPVHTEAVANIVGQAELIAANAILLAVLIHLRRPALHIAPARLSAILLLYMAGMLAKESAIVLPALLVLTDAACGRLVLRRKPLLEYVRSLAFLFTLLLLASTTYLLVRFQVLGSLTGADAAPALPYLHGSTRLLQALIAWPEYLRLLVWPMDLAADYAPAVLQPTDALTPTVLLGLLLLGGTAALALATFSRPALGLPASWFFICILPVSNLLVGVGVLVAERTQYLPSVAIAIAAAFGWDAFMRARRHSRSAVRLAGLVATAILVLFASRTVVRIPDWRDTSTIVDALVRDHPESYRSQWKLATDAAGQGDVSAAERHWLMAYRIWPFDSRLLEEYAAFHLAQGNALAAVPLLERAVSLQPDYVSHQLLLGRAYLRAGRYREALAALDQSARLSGFVQSLPDRAEALHRLGRFDEAAAAWRLAIRAAPRPSWLAWSALTRTLASGGHLESARTALAKAATSSDSSVAARRVLDALERALRTGCLAAQTCTDPLAQAPVRPTAEAWDSATASHNARPRLWPKPAAPSDDEA